MKKTDALRVKGLKKVYSNGTEALTWIDLTIWAGDFFALLGPNGAGKSTTIGIISGLTQKTAGHVSIDGYDIDTSPSDARLSVWVVPQEFNFGIFEKVYDIILSQAGYYGISPKKAHPNVEKYLKDLGLWDKRNAQARTLSGGMKRRLMIARALVHDPKVLILDEPTAWVDIELRLGMYEFLREINQKGTTIILTTHYLEEAETLCKHIAIIDKGTIVKHGSIKDLLANMEDEVISIDLDHSYTPISVFGSWNPEKHTDGIYITISKEYTLDKALHILHEAGYHIRNIKPKSGRLEEFFLKSTKK
jgi:ABC-2 type transport system ATP-binding protein